MAMPTGDTPQKAQDYYHYLLSHHETEHRVETWHVNWLALSWFWGFVAALALILIFWIWQYRTTRQKTGIYPIDSWSGYTSELAGPASLFLILFCAILTGLSVAIIVGHIVYGQIF
jgi:hypothetical protein